MRRLIHPVLVSLSEPKQAFQRRGVYEQANRWSPRSAGSSLSEYVLNPQSLFGGAGEEGFEVGRLLFAGYHADLDVLEAGLIEPPVQITFGEAQPAIPV